VPVFPYEMLYIFEKYVEILIFLVISRKFTEAKSINIGPILGLGAHSQNISL
jgi:hypothetical protein